jgi:hypothetical protein
MVFDQKNFILFSILGFFLVRILCDFWPKKFLFSKKQNFLVKNHVKPLPWLGTKHSFHIPLTKKKKKQTDNSKGDKSCSVVPDLIFRQFFSLLRLNTEPGKGERNVLYVIY